MASDWADPRVFSLALRSCRSGHLSRHSSLAMMIVAPSSTEACGIHYCNRKIRNTNRESSSWKWKVNPSYEAPRSSATLSSLQVPPLTSHSVTRLSSNQHSCPINYVHDAPIFRCIIGRGQRRKWKRIHCKTGFTPIFTIHYLQWLIPITVEEHDREQELFTPRSTQNVSCPHPTFPVQ